jgi:hypothetical protein
MPEKGEPRPGAVPEEPELLKALDHIARALRGLRFGEVTITVQDGVAVQVERTERTRLQKAQRR